MIDQSSDMDRTLYRKVGVALDDDQILFIALTGLGA